ncbi:hypothetical protein ILYODFUR_039068 [Ilyodon furcidens]|uniref:Uncharacterized protein n=1 Tax=Ilyodon furcidens TaxID=33524 RepID=A0ABV0TG20_9TELE
MNRPKNVLVHSELVFKQSSSSCCLHFEIMRPTQHLTVDQQYLAVARLEAGCPQVEAPIELRVSLNVTLSSPGIIILHASGSNYTGRRDQWTSELTTTNDGW